MSNIVYLLRDDNIIKKTHNTILYTGEDLVGRWLAGENVKINKCYIEFSNESNPSIPDYDKSDPINYYQMLETDPNRDIIRSDIVVTPKLDKTENHNSNCVWFYLVPTSDVGYFGKPFTPGLSKILGACLVYAKNDLLSNDVIFARTYLESPELKEDSTYSFLWKVVIENLEG